MLLDNFFQKLSDQIINPLIAIFIGMAVIVFLWGIVEFIANTGSEEARTTGKKHMVWGIIGLTIMFGVWGIINILQSFFEVGVIGPLG